MTPVVSTPKLEMESEPTLPPTLIRVPDALSKIESFSAAVTLSPRPPLSQMPSDAPAVTALVSQSRRNSNSRPTRRCRLTP